MSDEAKKQKSQLQLDIIKRIKGLMEEEGISQKEFGRRISIEQGNLSKSLSSTGSNNLTIDKIVAIADSYHLSVDYLLGRSETKANTAPMEASQIICCMMSMINNGDIRFAEKDIEVKEEVLTHSEKEMDNDVYPAFDKPTKKINKYKAFYFPNYDVIPKGFKKNSNDFAELIVEGNGKKKGMQINDFLEFYLGIYEAYRQNLIKREHFEIAVQDRLDKLF